MQEKNRQPTGKTDRLASMDYFDALDAFRRLPVLPCPTTRKEREARSMRPRVVLGVDKDWLKGSHATDARRSLGTSAQPVEKFREVSVDEIRRRALTTLGGSGRRHSKLAQNRPVPSMRTPPEEPDILERVHAITLPDGRKVVPELWRLPFGGLMRVLRERENLSLSDVASVAGVTPVAVSCMERHVATPRLDTLAGVLSCLHLSDAELDLVCYRFAQVCPRQRLEPGANPGSHRPPSRTTRPTARGPSRKLLRCLRPAARRAAIQNKTRKTDNPATGEHPDAR